MAELTKPVFTPPDPWRYQEESDAYTHIVRGPNNEFIVQCGQDTSGREEAKARFIAAAPELYAALNDAAGFVLTWACHHAIQNCVTEQDFEKATKPEGWHPVHREIYEKVKSALAKAEGK